MGADSPTPESPPGEGDSRFRTATSAMSQRTPAVVRNVSACAVLGTEVDLDRLAAALPTGSCRRGSANMNMDVLYVQCKVLSRSATASVYARGHVTFSGATSAGEAVLFARKVARMVRGAGFAGVTLGGYRITTMTATYNHDKPVRLEGVAHEHRLYATYEPEMHAGLTYRANDGSGAVVEVYANGKCTIMGVTSEAGVESARARIAAVLQKHEKKQPR